MKKIIFMIVVLFSVNAQAGFGNRTLRSASVKNSVVGAGLVAGTAVATNPRSLSGTNISAKPSGSYAYSCNGQQKSIDYYIDPVTNQKYCYCNQVRNSCEMCQVCNTQVQSAHYFPN